MQVGPGVDEVHDVGREVLSLPINLGEHLVELGLDNLDVGGSATVQSDQSGLGLLVSALLGEPSGREGQEEHSAEEDVSGRSWWWLQGGQRVDLQEKEDGGDDLDGQGNSPLSLSLEETTAVADPVGNKEAPSCGRH